MRTVHARMLAILLLPALSGPAFDAPARQDSPETPAAPPAGDPAAEPERFGLDPMPLVNDALGIRMHYPLGARITPSQTGERVTIEIRDAAEVPRWTIQIQPMSSKLVEPDAEAVAEMVRSQFQSRAHPPKIIEDTPVTIGGVRAHSIYFQDTGPDAWGATAGILIVPTGGSRFIVLRSSVFPGHLEAVKPLLDAAFRTLRVYDQSDLAAIRRQQTENAETFLKSLTPERLRSLVGTREWLRLYHEDPSGDWLKDREVGYLLMQVEEGPRGALTPDRHPSDYTAAEAEMGLVLRLDGRLIGDAEAGVYVDTQNIFWLAWDRSEEAWSIRMTRRQGEEEFSTAQTGLRIPPAIGTPYERVVVIETSDRRISREETTFVVPENQPYLSQPEVFMLAQLLPRDGSIRGDMGFRYYEPSLEGAKELAKRIDTWTPADDGSGRWTLRSQLLIDTPPIVSTVDASGRLLERRKGDGYVTQPIEYRRLVEIWKRKGLPTGSDPSAPSPLGRPAAPDRDPGRGRVPR